MKIAGILLGVLCAGALHARDLATIDGEHFQKVSVIARTAYELKIEHASGVTTLPLASLSDADLAELAPADRSQDGRFWYERSAAIYRQWKATGGDAAQLRAMMQPLAPYHALMSAYLRDLAAAQAEYVRRQTAAADREKGQSRAQAAAQWERFQVENSLTASDWKAMMEGPKRDFRAELEGALREQFIRERSR